jgi:large subunit ribosomal protein L23
MTGYDIIKRPVVSEKTTLQKEKANQVTFEVRPDANRIEIRRAVERIFNVKVVGVGTAHVRGKVKRRGRILGKRRNWKKAVVTLAPGERIDIFEGA